MTDANYTLTVANGTTDQSRNMFITLSGTLSTTRNVICPSASKLYVVTNSTTGSQSIVFKTAAGAGITVGNGQRKMLYCDGTNVLDATTGYTSLLFDAGSVSAPSISFVGNTTTGFWLPTTSTVALSTAGSERLRVDSTGNVGVGTTSPGEKLQVAGAIRATGAVAANAIGGILAYQGASTVMLGAWGADASTYGAIQFYQANSTGTLNRTGMLLDTAGNLGVGTNSPVSRLHVSGVSSLAASSGSIAANASGTTPTTASGQGMLQIISTDAAAIDKGGVLVFSANTTTLANYTMAGIAGKYETAGAGVYGGYLQFLTTASGGTPTERMRLDASGNLGIGTSSPTSKLHVVGGALSVQSTLGFGATFANTGGVGNYITLSDSGWSSAIGTSNGNLILYTAGNTTERARIDSSGNLGVGTSSPVSSLTIGSLGTTETGSTSYGAALIRGANYTLSNTRRGILDIEMNAISGQDNGATLTFTNNVGIFGQGQDYVGAGIKAAKENGTNTNQSTYLALYTNSSGTLAERARIDSSGNLGIGTSSPSTRLQAYDATSATIRATSGASANLDLTANATDVRVGTPNGVPLLFLTGATERMRIDSAGLVGIGRTSNPNYRTIIRGTGTTSATSGLVVENSSGTEYFNLNDAGNLGLGVTPSAWGSGFGSVIQTKNIGAFAASGPYVSVLANAYYNASSQYIYQITAAATHYAQALGQHQWYTAPSGTAGNPITFTQAMTLNASGELLLNGAYGMRVTGSVPATLGNLVTLKSASYGMPIVRAEEQALILSGTLDWQTAAEFNRAARKAARMLSADRAAYEGFFRASREAFQRMRAEREGRELAIAYEI
jgi:hypothetical protein